MNVAQIQRLQQLGRPEGPMQLPSPREGTAGPGTSFSETLNGAINGVDQAQKVSNEQIESFVAGETDNLHEVMLSMNQARVHFDLMTQVRNKSLEAYKELMSMQI